MRSATYFISDIHLGASYITDPRAHERSVVDWLHSIAHDAARLYLLGDILDYWYEYRTVVPRGFVRFFGALAELADAGVEITWFIGNHDIWIFDYLPSEIGLRVVDGSETVTIHGKKFYLAHGDAIGSLKPGFRFIRSVFRNSFCQKLYSAIHPRWTVPFAHSWSSSSRKSSGELARFLGEDREPFIPFARQLAADDPSLDFIILGHRHILLDMPVSASGTRLIVLGDWIHHFSYARFDGSNLSLIETSAITS
ncbi:MAG: UDP-2,3-diacylglucosamine diphosphatase [Muribaculaceae bacterium]|nr:UDP-2,3-diacylglucosamine diphosphatase [Muribaculaceae bacterium]